MKSNGKSLSARPLESLITSFKGMLVETEINDKPHRVTTALYCHSLPKVRNKPHIAGLSSRLLEMLGYDEK